MECLHLVELVEAMGRASVSEVPRRIEVCLAGVVVVNLGGEEGSGANGRIRSAMLMVELTEKRRWAS